MTPQDSSACGNYSASMDSLPTSPGRNGTPASSNGHFHWEDEVAWLRAVVAARLGEPQAVEEVLQEIAVQSLRQPAQGVRNQPGWLYRVAVRQCLLYRRRHGRQRRLMASAANRLDHNRAAAPDPLAWLLADERFALVRKAMACLPDRDGEILLLKYAHDCRYQDIARQMGISTSAVEARLFRARQRLRQELARLEADEETRQP